MRLLLTILACVLLRQGICQHATISGFVLDITTKKPLAGTKVDLSAKEHDNYTLVGTTVTDTAGSFTFQNIKPQHYSLACFYKMTAKSLFYPSQITDSLGRSETDSSFTLEDGQTYSCNFYLMVACPFDITKDQAECPNCKKHDMVQPIIWGQPVLDTKGKFVLNGKGLSEYYLGGCTPDFWCNPTKHCKRCDIDF